jgi:3-oxoacyl-[acyl-carrier protein] reductase
MIHRVTGHNTGLLFCCTSAGGVRQIAVQKERFLMEQRVALITGGVRGIGRAVAIALAERGWAVAASYRRSEEQARSLAAEIRALGKQALILHADVADPAAAEELVRRAAAEFGRIDALVNCAGSYHRTPLLEESTEGWHTMLNDNLHPVFYLSRAAAKGMIERKWGRIVNFSIAKADQLVGQPFITAHYIAKVGVLILTRSLAKILAPHGITANSISPGFIESGSMPQEEFAQLTKNIPAGYIGNPGDASSVVLYLLSEEARYVNGTNIHLSGAWGI